MTKFKTLLAAAALAASAAAFASGGHDAKHGGVVAETKAFDAELVAKPGSVQLHLRDHGGKPMAVTQISATLTLLSGAEKQEVELKPAGDRLEATGSFKVGAGTKAVAVVTVAGKASTVRFTLK
ncbi:MAG: hypothetical protein WAQ05_07950 [Rubrivivax sp.]